MQETTFASWMCIHVTLESMFVVLKIASAEKKSAQGSQSSPTLERMADSQRAVMDQLPWHLLRLQQPFRGLCNSLSNHMTSGQSKELLYNCPAEQKVGAQGREVKMMQYNEFFFVGKPHPAISWVKDTETLLVSSNENYR